MDHKCIVVKDRSKPWWRVRCSQKDLPAYYFSKWKDAVYFAIMHKHGYLVNDGHYSD